VEGGQWAEAGGGRDAEELEYGGEECAQLLAGLARSTRLLPPAHRLLSGLPVGFLPL
jgi:hypothetical protein